MHILEERCFQPALPHDLLPVVNRGIHEYRPLLPLQQSCEQHCPVFKFVVARQYYEISVGAPNLHEGHSNQTPLWNTPIRSLEQQAERISMVCKINTRKASPLSVGFSDLKEAHARARGGLRERMKA